MCHNRDNLSPAHRSAGRRLRRCLRESGYRAVGATTLLAFLVTSLGACIAPVGQPGSCDSTAPANGANGCTARQPSVAILSADGRTCCCSQDRRDAGTCCCCARKAQPSQRRAGTLPRSRDPHGPTWSVCQCGGPQDVWMVNAQPKLSGRNCGFTPAVSRDRLFRLPHRTISGLSLEPATPPPRPTCTWPGELRQSRS